MTRTEAESIVNWAYDEPYSLYDLNGSSEALEELLNQDYSTVYATDEGLVGFYCTGPAAQVPAGWDEGAYGGSDDGRPFLDFGIGMRPGLTGQGLGTFFLGHVLKDLTAEENSLRLRLTVATFNRRAIRLYEKFGFQYVMDFSVNGTCFQTMIR
ncbi:GNAT family N-acetyltransferase [Alicyclobacillus sp. SO9]|nr:GNAT family N-acetyltransferase [Alicyclobacillus sp. SO9]